MGVTQNLKLYTDIARFDWLLKNLFIFFQEAEVKADSPIADRVVEPDNNQLLEINLNHRRTQKFKKEMSGQLKSIEDSRQFWLHTNIITSISHNLFLLFAYYRTGRNWSKRWQHRRHHSMVHGLGPFCHQFFSVKPKYINIFIYIFIYTTVGLN